MTPTSEPTTIAVHVHGLKASRSARSSCPATRSPISRTDPVSSHRSSCSQRSLYLDTTIGLREPVHGLRQPHHTLNMNVTFPTHSYNHARFRTPPTRYSPHPELARTHASKDQLTNCASVLRTSGTYVQQHWRGFRAPYMYTVCDSPAEDDALHATQA